ncbi:uncharacterized protein LOC131950780 [Physella acuta]|uniref:uncharacterized protein LOC131950780 n=1 Tax=Physella acuta TaxID=109671 RepID=UPI0027DD7A52|nr:uncharacterized protein LOC131950780 [Physella acuta]
MDLDSSDADSDVRELILFVERNPLQRLHTFMEDVTTKLPAGNPVQLLLFGKTGHGKSSSGNSILLEKVFQSSDSSQSMTQHAMLNYKLIDNRLINVIDTQGVLDTGLDIQDRSNLDLAVRSVSEGINLCRDGFHALVLVLTIDSRFTDGEKQVFELIRNVLGKDVIKLHGILLFTKADTRMDKIPFSEWLKMKHDSAFEQLIQECNYRCVLFDNKTEDPKKMKLQLIKLINLVDSLNGAVYLNEIFDAAENCRLECVHKNPLLNKVYVNALRTIECAAKFITQEKDNAKNYQDQLLLDLSVEIKKFSSNVKKAPSETLKKIVVSLASVRAMVKKYMRSSQFATLDVEEFEPCYKLIVQSEEHCVALLRDDNFETLKSIARLLGELLKGNRELSEGCKNMLHQTRVALNEFFTIFPTTKSKELQVLLKSFSNFNEQVNEVLSTGRLLLLKTQACQEVERIIDRFKNAEQEMDAKVLPYVIAAVNEKKCFPGNALVLLDTGKFKMLKDLQVGERVLARDGAGRLVFDEVYMFGHRQISAYGLFTKIYTENHAVSVTENHFVFVVNECGESCVPARDVKVGDFVLVSSGKFLKISRVTKITHVYEEGLYAPFTKTGTVVVDGVLTSCYIDVLPHDTCHRLLWPVRLLYRVSPAALDTINGVSQSTCVPWWASAAAKFLK